MKKVSAMCGRQDDKNPATRTSILHFRIELPLYNPIYETQIWVYNHLQSKYP